MVTASTRPFALRLGALLLWVTASGCGTDALVEDSCLILEDCFDYNERELEECRARGQGLLDQSAIYGCEDSYIEALECFVDEDDCESGAVDCADEYSDYAECVDDASSADVDIES
jgi:hypothetical protein